MANYERVRGTDEDYHDDKMREGDDHATTGGAAASGAVTGGVIGAVGGGPVGAAVGAVGGAIAGAAAERAMHADDDAEREGLRDESDTYTSTTYATGTPSTMPADHEHLYRDNRCSECGFVRPD